MLDYDVSVTFLISETKYLTGSNLRAEGLILGKTWQQEHEVADHIASVFRK